MSQKRIPAIADPKKAFKKQALEQFALSIVSGEDASTAFRKAYPNSRKWKPESVHVQACRLLPKVIPRIEYLRKQATDSEIADIIERKRILSQIARGKMPDYGEMGAAGFVPNIGPDVKNPHAIAEMTSVIRSGATGDGSDDSVVEKIKLRDPMSAIDLLNKMDGLYKTNPDALPEGLGITIVYNPPAEKKA